MNEWIKFEDKEPPKGQSVIVCVEDFDTGKRKVTISCGIGNYIDKLDIKCADITGSIIAWMPLPKIPRWKSKITDMPKAYSIRDEKAGKGMFVFAKSPLKAIEIARNAKVFPKSHRLEVRRRAFMDEWYFGESAPTIESMCKICDFKEHCYKINGLDNTCGYL